MAKNMRKKRVSGTKTRAIVKKCIETFEHLAVGLIKIWIGEHRFIVRESDITGLALDELKKLLPVE